jgi:predicted Zn-dependent protease
MVTTEQYPQGKRYRSTLVDTSSNDQREHEIRQLPSICHDHFMAAKVKISQEGYRDALRELEGTITSKPEEEAIKLLLLGQANEGLNNTAQALAAYRKARSIAPNLSVAVLREGVLKYKLGNLEEAKQLLSQYTKLESGNPEAFYYLFLLAHCQGDTDKKAMFTERVIALDAPNGYWSNKILSLAKTGKGDTHNRR